MDMFLIPLIRLSRKFTISSKLFPTQSSGLSSKVVSPCIGGTIGPTLTFGYPYEPTKTDGGLEPSSESDVKRFACVERYSSHLLWIPFLISELSIQFF